MLHEVIYLPTFYEPNKVVKRLKDICILRYIKLLFFYVNGLLIPRQFMKLVLLFL